MKAAGERLLTEVELELMTIVWRLGEATVNEVLEGLPAQRPLAYTSVSTILRILEKKRFLKTRKQGRGHVYIPLVSKETYEARSLDDIIERVFDGTPTALMRRLVESERLSPRDLAAVRALLEGKRR
jgi:BlaI family transcriptional regulator, penicillinase repressor